MGHAADPVLQRRVDKEAQPVGVFCQSVVSAAADDDAGPLGGQLADGVEGGQIDLLLQGFPRAGAGESLEQQVYLATFNTIRQLAAEGSCVIIGRCADYALAENPNRLSLFIHAPLQDRVRRVAHRMDLQPEKAKTLIQKTDKRRASYYEYYSSQRWGKPDSYDFCLNSSLLGLGGTVELIRAMVEHKEHPVPSPTEIDPTRPN